jgi:hypothetical protein
MLTINTNGYIYFESESNSIRALNYDLDASESGGIYYQNLNSQSNDFNSIKSDINLLNSDFIPTDLFRITYDNVPAYGNKLLIASFQIILAKNSNSSFVVLKYTSCLSNITIRVTPGIYYTLLNRSPPIHISNPCFSSNVNLTGTWVFDVSFKSGMCLIRNYFS